MSILAMERPSLQMPGNQPAAATDKATDSPTSSSLTPQATAPTIPTTNGTQALKQTSSLVNSIAVGSEASRNASPIRYPRKVTSSSRLGGTRSRTNSQQDLSPTRSSRSQIPSYAATQRSLSTSGTPSLPPANKQDTTTSSDSTGTPQKSVISSDLKDVRWPVSPRLRSPPPQLNKSSGPTTPRATDIDPPAINIQQASPAAVPVDSTSTAACSEKASEESSLSSSGTRTPVRSALETVQEVATPSRDAGLLEQVKEKLSLPDNHSDTAALSDGARNTRARPTLAQNESGSDSGTNATDTRRTTSVPPSMPRQSSSLSTKQSKVKGEGSTQNMTVETETVASIPQVALATGSKNEGVNGTLRAKQSTETIRPKKDRKKVARKQPSVNNGTGKERISITH